MSTRNSKLWLIGLSMLLAMACTSTQTIKSNNRWTDETLAAALENSSRPKADRDRDADRKPVQLMTFFGVERGMTVVDLIAGAGYMTEVCAIATGSEGKVYSQHLGVNKNLDARLAGNRLPNVERVDTNIIPAQPGSIDVVITVMNLHDLYNSDLPITQAAMKYMLSLLKPGGVLAVVDHVGIAGADNAKLHRMTKQQAIDVVTQAGFVLEAESNLLAHTGDDHTRSVIDPSIRGKTDQFILKFRKPT